MSAVNSNGRVSLAVATALTILPTAGALAHGFAGSRFFPATIVIDDPFVADELSLPTVSNAAAMRSPRVVFTRRAIAVVRDSDPRSRLGLRPLRFPFGIEFSRPLVGEDPRGDSSIECAAGSKTIGLDYQLLAIAAKRQIRRGL